MFSTDFSLYSHKALYVHPKALNGDSKASDVRSKPSNGGQKLLIVTTHAMGWDADIFRCEFRYGEGMFKNGKRSVSDERKGNRTEYEEGLLQYGIFR